MERIEKKDFMTIVKKIEDLYNVKKIILHLDNYVTFTFESGLVIDFYTIPLPERDIVAYKLLKPEYIDNKKVWTEFETLAAIIDMINMRTFKLFPVINESKNEV